MKRTSHIAPALHRSWRSFVLGLFLLSLGHASILAQDEDAPVQDQPALGEVEALPGIAMEEPDMREQASELPLQMGEGEELFREAVRFYESRQFEDALEAYRMLLQQGHEAADLYYNMGNAAFRSNSIGYSILYYKKALKLDPSHQDAKHNLQYVSRYREDAFDEVPEFFLRTWMQGLNRALPERGWSTMALVFFGLSLLTLLLYLFSRRLGLKKTAFFVGLATLLLFAFSFSHARVAHLRLVHPSEGIIVAPSVVVRSTPSDAGNELFILHEGTPVDVNESLTDWQNIRIIDGREGWIRISDFEFI